MNTKAGIKKLVLKCLKDISIEKIKDAHYFSR